MGRMENDIIDGSFRGWDLRKFVGVILFRFIILSLFHIHFSYSTTRLCGSVEMFNLVYIWSCVLTYSLVCHVVTHELSFLITIIYSSSRPPQHDQSTPGIPHHPEKRTFAVVPGWLGLVIGSFGSAGGVADMPRVLDRRAGVYNRVGLLGVEGTSKYM